MIRPILAWQTSKKGVNSDWDEMDYNDTGYVALRSVLSFMEKNFPMMALPEPITWAIAALHGHVDDMSRETSLRNWVDYRHFVPLIVGTYFFYRGLSAFESEDRVRTKTVDIREFRFTLRKCGVRVAEQESLLWYSNIEAQQPGGRNATGTISFARAILFICTKQLGTSGGVSAAADIAGEVEGKGGVGYTAPAPAVLRAAERAAKKKQRARVLQK